MPSPPEDSTVAEPDVVIVDNVQKLSHVDVSMIITAILVVALTKVAITKGVTWFRKLDLKPDGHHETIESAKEAFQVTCKENFHVEWTENKTRISEKWTYEEKTYETYAEVEEVEEMVEEAEAEIIIAFDLGKGKPLVEGEKGGSAGLSTSALTAVQSLM
ncbi:hypothetical protein BGZ75_010287 [Mortierella antarctica]|nr:hypothetical protein BGZ75_010287 [Mortierella antarctica]